MYMYTCHCLFSGTPLRARTFIRNVRWGGHNSTVRVTLPEVWARSVQCVARGKPFFYTFLDYGILEENPRVSATSPGMVFPYPPVDWVSASLCGLSLRIPPGIGFPHPLSSCTTHVKFGCKPGFSARRGYTYIYFPILAQNTTLRSCRPAAVKPPCSSNLQLYARVAAVVVADCFDRSVPLVTPPYPIFLLCCRCVRMSIACP